MSVAREGQPRAEASQPLAKSRWHATGEAKSRHSAWDSRSSALADRALRPSHLPVKPLEPTTRVQMERAFQHDFSRVRVHTDPTAGAAVARVGATGAFAIGRQLYFAAGRYDPVSPSGRRLLAHELAHVVQQDNGGGRRDGREDGPSLAALASAPRVSGADRLEAEARAAAAAVVSGGSPVVAHSSPVLVARNGDAGAADSAVAQAATSPADLSTASSAAFEPGILPAQDARRDPAWVEFEIARDHLSDTAPWTYTLTYTDGATLVIPLEQVFNERLPGATITVFRRHKASRRIVPCVLSQDDQRLKALSSVPVGDFGAVADLAVPRFDTTTAPRIVSLLNAAQMIWAAIGMLKVMQLQTMNPLMGGGMASGSRAGAGAVARGVGAGAAARVAGRESLTFVEIGAGDLKAAIDLAKQEGVKVIAVDPVPASAAAIQQLEALGGRFVKGAAADLAPGTADHVFQYFPWRIGGTGSFVSGGTWRLVGDAMQLLKPAGVAHFVTEDLKTAEYLAGEASSKGFRAVITKTTAGAAAPGASGAAVPSFSSTLEVWLVNIYKG